MGLVAADPYYCPGGFSFGLAWLCSVLLFQDQSSQPAKLRVSFSRPKVLQLVNQQLAEEMPSLTRVLGQVPFEYMHVRRWILVESHVKEEMVKSLTRQQIRYPATWYVFPSGCWRPPDLPHDRAIQALAVVMRTIDRLKSACLFSWSIELRD